MRQALRPLLQLVCTCLNDAGEFAGRSQATRATFAAGACNSPTSLPRNSSREAFSPMLRRQPDREFSVHTATDDGDFFVSLGVINDRLGSGHRVLRHTNRRWSCKHAVKIFEARAFQRQLGNPILGYLEASTSFRILRRRSPLSATVIPT